MSENKKPDVEGSVDSATQAGFVAILGAPNAGKSTLLNALVGTKVSIVTPKVQTTRRRIIGITNQAACQIMFIDTPGIFEPRKRLDKAMVSAAWSAAHDADLTLLVIDSQKGLDQRTRAIIARLSDSRPQALFLVLNKIDLIPRDKLLPLVKELSDFGLFDETFMISALKTDGLSLLLDRITADMPPGPWLFPEDQLSDLSNRSMAAEVTREKLFLRLKQELPYAVTIETDGWTESPDGGEIRIDQTIYAMRPSQKAIILGHRGQQIKAIGEAARKDLEQMFEARVHLFLFVKVRERWADDPDRYREIGLDFPE